MNFCRTTKQFLFFCNENDEGVKIVHVILFIDKYLKTTIAY